MNDESDIPDPLTQYTMKLKLMVRTLKLNRLTFRRAKLFYLRDRVGKATRVKQRFDRPLEG